MIELSETSQVSGSDNAYEECGERPLAGSAGGAGAKGAEHEHQHRPQEQHREHRRSRPRRAA